MPLTKKFSRDGRVCKVGFSLAAEVAGEPKKLFLAGEFNGWKPAPMRKAKGVFSLGLELPAGASYQYRFVTDAGVWLNDTGADCYIHSSFADADNSVVTL